MRMQTPKNVPPLNPKWCVQLMLPFETKGDRSNSNCFHQDTCMHTPLTARNSFVAFISSTRSASSARIRAFLFRKHNMIYNIGYESISVLLFNPVNTFVQIADYLYKCHCDECE